MGVVRLKESDFSALNPDGSFQVIITPEQKKEILENQKLMELVNDFGELERICLDVEYSTVPGVDVEKLQKLLLEKVKGDAN
jgi:hypothetical protein